MKMKLCLVLCCLFGLIYLSNGQTFYENPIYGFKAKVPPDWKFYREIINDTTLNVGRVGWGLPNVYSELEKADIENDVTISAYRNPAIKDIDGLIDFEFKRIRHSITSKILVDSLETRSYILLTEFNGLKYKTKEYFIFKNNIGYVVSFTATPGTYDKNITVFEDFFKNIAFDTKP